MEDVCKIFFWRGVGACYDPLVTLSGLVIGRIGFVEHVFERFRGRKVHANVHNNVI